MTNGQEKSGQCVFVRVVEQVSGNKTNVCATRGENRQRHQDRSCCSSVINHKGSDSAAPASRSRMDHNVMHMHILLVISFQEQTDEHFLPAACGFVISALINVCVNQFTNSTKQCASSCGLKIDF